MFVPLVGTRRKARVEMGEQAELERRVGELEAENRRLRSSLAAIRGVTDVLHEAALVVPSTEPPYLARAVQHPS